MMSPQPKLPRVGGRMVTAAWAVVVLMVELVWVALLVYGIVWAARR